MKKSIFILISRYISHASPLKKQKKKSFRTKSDIKSLKMELKLPCKVIQNQLFKFGKIILKLIMKKIPQPFVT